MFRHSQRTHKLRCLFATNTFHSPLLRCSHPGPRSFAELAPKSKLENIDASRLTVTEAKSRKALERPEELIFGRTFTGPFLPYTINAKLTAA